MSSVIPTPRRCARFVAIFVPWACLLGWFGPALAQPIPTVEFVSEKVYVREDEGTVFLQISISGMPLAQTSVQANTVEDTADIDDFVDTATNALWNYGDASTKQIAIEIRVDAVEEPDERFFVDLHSPSSGSIELGARTRAEVIILNDDNALRPYFQVEPDWLQSTDGKAVYLATDGAQVELTVLLSVPAPAGFSAQYSLDGGIPLNLPFAEGSQSATLLVPPPTEPVPGYEHGKRSIRLIDAVAAEKNSINEVSGGYAIIALTGCAVCAISGVSFDFSVHDRFCPFGCETITCKEAISVAPDPIVVLQGYRDQILDATEEGLFYVDLYAQLSTDIFLTVFDHPQLLTQLNAARGEWIPAFAALVDGSGASYQVLPTMESSLANILDTLEASGRPALVDAVQRERTRLMLDSITGITMAQLQERLETLGGQVRAQLKSWAGLKGMFGGE